MVDDEQVNWRNLGTIAVEGRSGWVSFDALRFLSEYGVTLVGLKYDGHLDWQFIGGGERTKGVVRLLQYQAALDPRVRAWFASAIVSAKVKASFQFLGMKSQPFREFATVREAMAYEAIRSSAYWGKYAERLHALGYEFTSRMSPEYGVFCMNARDPINACLNYVYALAYGESRRAIYSVGLDPYVGLSHRNVASRESLTYDFVDLIRWNADASVLQVAREGIRKEDYFKGWNFNIVLYPELTSRLSEAFRESMTRKVPFRGKMWNYRTILQDNVERVGLWLRKPEGVLRLVIPSLPSSLVQAAATTT
jgi:CRISPR-associated protein Cas1